ncbi:TRAP transporter small permease subunit [Anderseniella sp. Alg231-50]|uniref:TRAP transporter small permease subunit n=1 Tax=Anderseniella sp. Alg231-50 TaxID=1922226 RepID=UPI000D54C8F1
MQVISKVHAAFVGMLGFSAGVALACLAVLITMDVTMRNLGLGNFPWLLEVSEYVLFAATFLAAPWVLRENAHVRVDLLLTALPRAAGRLLANLADVLGLVISGVLTWYALRVTADALERGDLIFKELVVPEWPFFVVVVVSGVLLMAEFSLRLAKQAA